MSDENSGQDPKESKLAKARESMSEIASKTVGAVSSTGEKLADSAKSKASRAGGSIDQWTGRTKEVASSLADGVASSTKESATYLGSGFKSVAGSTAELANRGFEKSGAKYVIDRTGEKLDEVSGKAMLDEVRSYLEKQSAYNDVLATKLQEALDRIEVLENKLFP